MQRRVYVSIICVLIVLTVTGVGNSAFASTIQLKISDGTNTIIIDDDGPGDRNKFPNVIVATGTIGVWTFDLTPHGTGGGGLFEALNGTVQSSQAGSLTLEWTMTDHVYFDPVAFYYGYNSTGTTDYAMYADPSNAAFGHGGSSFLRGPFGPGLGFSPLSPSGDYHETWDPGFARGTIVSMTTVAHIDHADAGLTAFDVSSEVPEPPTLTLLFTGLIGFVSFGNVRRFAVKS